LKKKRSFFAKQKKQPKVEGFCLRQIRFATEAQKPANRQAGTEARFVFSVPQCFSGNLLIPALLR